MASISLHSLKISDLKDIMSWVNDLEIIGHITTLSKHFTEEDEIVYISKMISSRTDFVFTIRFGSKYIGQIGIHEIYDGVGRLAIVIGSKKNQGKGYGSTAIRLILEKAFLSLNLNKVYLMILSDNKKGQKLYKRLGFKKEGELKQEYYHNGVYHDMLRMAILKTDWLKAKSV